MQDAGLSRAGLVEEVEFILLNGFILGCKG